MNDALITFARKELKDGLSKCSEDEQHVFKQMYSNGNLKMEIMDVVDKMEDEKLSRAMEQVDRTTGKIGGGVATGVHYSSPTNSTSFSDCCGTAVGDDESNCPGCKRKISGR